MSDALPLDLPKAASGGEQQTVLAVELGPNGEMAVNQARIEAIEELKALAGRARQQDPELRVVIKADGDTPHRRVIEVMDTLRQVPIDKIAFGVRSEADPMSTDLTFATMAVLSLGAHGLMLRALPSGGEAKAESSSVSEVEIWQAPDLEPAPTDPPEPLPESEPEASTPVTSPAVAPNVRSASSPPPPVAAGAALTAEAEDGLADFTLVAGTNGAFVGGVTSSRSTLTKRSEARSAGVGVSSPTTPERGADRSSPARAAAASWSCSHLFPKAADEADIHHAIVTLVVQVSAGGAATGVRIISDPGHGFGAAARACARAQRFIAATDRSGRAMSATTAPLSIRFTR